MVLHANRNGIVHERHTKSNQEQQTQTTNNRLSYSVCWQMVTALPMADLFGYIGHCLCCNPVYTHTRLPFAPKCRVLEAMLVHGAQASFQFTEKRIFWFERAQRVTLMNLFQVHAFIQTCFVYGSGNIHQNSMKFQHIPLNLLRIRLKC